MIFNSLSWNRTDVVDFQVNFGEGQARSVAVKDAEGHDMPVQCQIDKLYSDGSIQSAKVYLMAENIPSIGYRTFYLQASEKIAAPDKGPSPENEYYKIAFADGGLNSIYDKSLQKELVDDSKFACRRSIYHGIGGQWCRGV